jgi:hypothetical protein
MERAPKWFLSRNLTKPYERLLNDGFGSLAVIPEIDDHRFVLGVQL